MSDDWERHRAFLAVLREGSLSGAARALALAQPTVRRRIAELEDGLGIALFTRAPDGLVPTDATIRLREHAEAMELAAAAFARAATRSDGIAGIVRVSASEVIAVEVLPPILAGLRRRHPALIIAVSPSNRTEDLLHREADVAIRMVRPEQNALVARRIGSVELGLHGRAELIAGRTPPETLSDIREIGLIGVERDSPVLRAMRAGGLDIGLDGFCFRSDSDLAHLAAIRAGIGIGVCQVPIAARDARLIRMMPSFTYPLDVWVAMHEDVRGSAPVRAVFDSLAEGVGAYLAPTR